MMVAQLNYQVQPSIMRLMTGRSVTLTGHAKKKSQVLVVAAGRTITKNRGISYGDNETARFLA